MNTSFYIPISEDFATEMNGKKLRSNVFLAVQKKDRSWVVSSNALNDFPDDFANYSANGGNLTPILLSIDDFMTPG